MVCFMAIEENIDEGRDTGVKEDNPSYDDLFCAFEKIHEDMQRL